MANAQFKKLRKVTLPVLKLPKDDERFLFIVGPMHIGKTTQNASGDAKDDGKKKMEPAMVAHALDMSTGEEGIIICPAVLQNELNSNYPGETYVDRGFSIALTRVPEKRYNIVQLSEVEVPDEVRRAAKAIRDAIKAAEKVAEVTKAATKETAKA